MRIPDFYVSSFLGLNTFIKDTKTLKPGVAASSNNWLTSKFGDHIALRRGTLLLGTRQTGAGKVTGIGVGTKADGSQILFFTHGRKAKYYDADTEDNVEIGTNLLPSDANGDDIWFHPYHNLAGAFMYLGGLDAGAFKIPLANPGSAKDQQVTDRYGKLVFDQGRAFAGLLKASDGSKLDKTSLYVSKIDKDTFSQYTQVTAEAIGSSGSTVYTGTLAGIAAKRTIFLLVVYEAGGETLIDNGDGTLTGNQGSTGTINYATGVYTITFNHTTTGAVTADYRWEDATSGGVLDFSFSTPRTAGEGDVQLEADGGGPFQSVLSFLGVQYVFHKTRTWEYSYSNDDTEAVHLPYRNIGIPYPLAAAKTPEGILLIDVSNPSDPKVRRMQVGENTDNLTIVPVPISDALDLSGHAFDYAIAFRWGDYEIVVCQDYTNAVKDPFNSIMYVRNVVSGAWDRLDVFASCFAEHGGTLVFGDFLSNNIFTLFSGFDDDGSPIENHWQDGQLNLRTDNLKVAHWMRVTGLIQKEQEIEVYLTLDDGSPILVFTIEGDGAYVDQGINTSIGSYTIGSKVIGGGGEATAHPFDVTFQIHTDRFQYISTLFKATQIGHAQINSYGFKDIRDKGTRSLPVKTA